MKTRTIARYQLRDGSFPLPPNPAFALLEDGKPVANFTVHQLEDLALQAIEAIEERGGTLAAWSWDPAPAEQEEKNNNEGI